MLETVAANEITLGKLKQSLGLRLASDPNFFSQWSEGHSPLSESEKRSLDRVKANFLELIEEPPLLENTVKMVVLAPLLDLAGFYHKPFRLETETSVNLEMQGEEQVIRGRIDVLVLKNRLWLLVIESKRSNFAVTAAIPQALVYLLANPAMAQPTFGLITNGNEFLFLKARSKPVVEYGNSRLFSLVNPNNELYAVLQILKQLGQEILEN